MNLHPVEKKLIVQELNSAKEFIKAIIKAHKKSEVTITINTDFHSLNQYSAEGAEGLNAKMARAQIAFRKALDVGLCNQTIYDFFEEQSQKYTENDTIKIR